jgi:hypothetical protein
VERALGPARDRLLALGLLREAAPSRFAACAECGRGHVRRVEWLADRRTGRSEPFVPCGECGAVRISPDSLRRWAIDVPALLAGALAAAGGTGTPTEVVSGHLWHLGHVTWCERSREVYFTRCVHNRNRVAVVAALAAHPRAVLFLPTEASARGWAAATSNPVIALESVVSLGPDGLTFDAPLVEGRLADAGFDAPKPKPPRKRDGRAGKIERMVRELRTHLREARDNAHATRDLTGTPQLLPRPTQKDLAARCGLTEADVSRCLKDPEAHLLRLLWEAAADLDRILAWDGSVGGDPP